MAKIVYEVKQDDNYHKVILPKYAYFDASLGKGCSNCAFCGHKARHGFCCKNTDAMYIVGNGVCDGWKSQRFWWLHINPIKKFKAEMHGIEFRYITERQKNYKELMLKTYGREFNHLTQKWVKVH